MKINKTKLVVGNVFKNYAHMCTELGLKQYPSGSASWYTQLRKLKAFCEFERLTIDEKKTHAIIITKVFAEDSLILFIDKSKHKEVTSLLQQNGYFI